MNLFNQLLLLGLYLTCSLNLMAASEEEFGAAINVAGRQRMLTQKMAKEVLLVNLKIDSENNSASLAKTMALFESSLRELIAGSAANGLPKPPNPKIMAKLNEVDALWTAYKKAIDSKNIGEVAKQSLPILQTMNAAVKLYEKASVIAGIKGKGKVINIAGRQRMLTQKMAKEALLIAANIDSDKNRKQLKSTQTLFTTSLKALKEGNSNMRIKATQSEKIKKQLDMVAKIWDDYGPIMESAATGKKVTPAMMQKISDLSPKILFEMNMAVNMFEKEQRKQI